MSSRSQPIAHVPRIQPNENDIEDFEVFRETFLARIHDPAHNEACRSFASDELEHELGDWAVPKGERGKP